MTFTYAPVSAPPLVNALFYYLRRSLQLPLSLQRNINVANPQIKLRTKLLVGFSLAFSLVFAGAFYWFYTFATERTLSHLKADMRSTLLGAAQNIDVNELLALYAEGEQNATGFSDDPRYHRQLQWLEAVHQIEPSVWLYTYIVGTSEQNRRIGASVVQPGELEVIHLVDLWALHDHSKANQFLESDHARAVARAIAQEKRWVGEPEIYTSEIYTDEWGEWLSAAIPLQTLEGNAVAVLGVDVETSHLVEAQQTIRKQVVSSFLVAYGILFVVLYVLSGVLAQHLNQLTRSVKWLGIGAYKLNRSCTSQACMGQDSFPDELTTLAQVFECMVDSIRTREEQIKESQRIEYETRLALQQERELNELKSRFVSMVSHELRTPLTVIRTSMELIENYGHLASEEKKQDYFNRCRTAIVNMSQLLEDVLTINKAEAGKLAFSPALTHLSHFCEELVDEVRMGSGTNHTVQFKRLGDCTNSWVDKTLLRSILINLLTNAIKYSPSGSTVEFTLTCTDRIATFTICDEGIGIPVNDQPHLFELFHRASNVSTIRGTGLGLAIVKQCVEQHHGQIHFSSQEGVGTTFTVILPIHCCN